MPGLFSKHRLATDPSATTQRTGYQPAGLNTWDAALAPDRCRLPLLYFAAVRDHKGHFLITGGGL